MAAILSYNCYLVLTIALNFELATSAVISNGTTVGPTYSRGGQGIRMIFKKTVYEFFFEGTLLQLLGSVLLLTPTRTMLVSPAALTH